MADQISSSHQQEDGTSRGLRQRFKHLLKPNPHTTANIDATILEYTADDANSTELVASTTAQESYDDDDMWMMAENILRMDPEKCKKLNEYDSILTKQFGTKLEPIGTPGRREQFGGFLVSEVEKLNRIKSKTPQRNEARQFFRRAAACVVTTKDIIGPATTTCLPASVACTGVAVLLSVSFATNGLG